MLRTIQLVRMWESTSEKKMIQFLMFLLVTLRRIFLALTLPLSSLPLYFPTSPNLHPWKPFVSTAIFYHGWQLSHGLAIVCPINCHILRAGTSVFHLCLHWLAPYLSMTGMKYKCVNWMIEWMGIPFFLYWLFRSFIKSISVDLSLHFSPVKLSLLLISFFPFILRMQVACQDGIK